MLKFFKYLLARLLFWRLGKKLPESVDPIVSTHAKKPALNPRRHVYDGNESATASSTETPSMFQVAPPRQPYVPTWKLTKGQRHQSRKRRSNRNK